MSEPYDFLEPTGSRDPGSQRGKESGQEVGGGFQVGLVLAGLE